MIRATAVTLIAASIGMGAVVAAKDRPAALPFYRSATMTPEWLSNREASAPGMHRVSPFTLTDQGGRTVTERAFAGHVTVAHFFFTTCGDICPNTTRNVARLLSELASDSTLQVLSFSVAPDRDSVGALRMFAAMHGIIDPRWHLLTGPRADIERLARESFFVRLGRDTTYGVATIAHTESLLLVDANGRLRGVYAGTLGLEMDRLREDIAASRRP